MSPYGVKDTAKHKQHKQTTKYLQSLIVKHSVIEISCLEEESESLQAHRLLHGYLIPCDQSPTANWLLPKKYLRHGSKDPPQSAADRTASCMEGEGGNTCWRRDPPLSPSTCTSTYTVPQLQISRNYAGRGLSVSSIST